MNKRHIVVMGLGMGLAGCGNKSAPEPPIATNPPDATTGGAEPVAPEMEEPHGNPPPPPASGFPEWDAVASGHPPGATNPPMAVLVMTPDRACYKTWASPMSPRGGLRGDRVEDPLVTAGGTRVECPEPRAAQVFDAWKAAGSPKNPEPQGTP